MQPGRYIGVDIGGTKIAAGWVDMPSGSIGKFRTCPTRPERGGRSVLDDLAGLTEGLAKESDCPIRGVGVGTCELVSRSGEMLTSGCLNFSTVDLRERLGRTGPVNVEADVRVAGLAEAHFGAGRGARCFLYLTIGTGISSCLLIDGKPFSGARGAAGTLASGPLPVHQPPLEHLASGPGMVAVHGNATSAEAIFAAAEQGDPKAKAIVAKAGAAVGAAIGWLVNVLDPDLVVLGGGIGLQPGLYRDQLIEAARDHVWWPEHRNVPIIPAATGAAAGVLGAAIAASMRAG